jgi:hypothetical protein
MKRVRPAYDVGAERNGPVAQAKGECRLAVGFHAFLLRREADQVYPPVAEGILPSRSRQTASGGRLRGVNGLMMGPTISVRCSAPLAQGQHCMSY